MMSDRLPLNSASLQARFPEVYQEFFAQNDLVISYDFCYPLSHGLRWRHCGVSIHQKLPCKVYFGARKAGKRNTISIGSVVLYDTFKREFSAKNADTLHLDWKETVRYLTRHLKKDLGFHDGFDGFTCNILIERTVDRAFYINVDAAFIAAVYLLFEQMTAEEIEAMAKLSGREIQNTQNALATRYKKLHAAMMKLHARTVNRQVTGGNHLSTFIASSFPIVHFAEERGGSIREPYKNLPPLDVYDDVDALEKMHWWGFRLSELAEVEDDFPLDVVSIFPGGTQGKYAHLADYTTYSTKTIMPAFDELAGWIAQIFSPLLTADVQHIPAFLKEIERGDYWYQYSRGQTVYSLQLLKLLINGYQKRFSSPALQECLEAITKQQYITAPFEELPSFTMQRIISAIEQRASARGVPIGMRSFAVGKRSGNIFVYAPPEHFRDDIFEVVEDLQKNYDANIHLDFVSWRDGWGKDGLRVEQFVSKGVYSEFLKPDSVQLTHRTARGKLGTRIIESMQLEHKKFDLLFDLPRNKLYVRGKECTSKEIPSQKAVVEIVSALLSAEGHRLHNRALPESSYTKYRNELQGKIVGPLVALVKKRLKKELSLKVEGTLTDFWVSLDPKGFEIGVIRKM